MAYERHDADRFRVFPLKGGFGSVPGYGRSEAILEAAGLSHAQIEALDIRATVAATDILVKFCEERNIPTVDAVLP